MVFLTALTATAATKATTEVIYSFAGGADGEYLDTDVAIDAAGNLYGPSGPRRDVWRWHSVSNRAK